MNFFFELNNITDCENETLNRSRFQKHHDNNDFFESNYLDPFVYYNSRVPNHNNFNEKQCYWNDSEVEEVSTKNKVI